MTHTPGPWKIADEEIEIVGGMGFHKIETVDQTIHEGESPCPVALAYCIDTHVFEHLGDSEENAKLIAASPEMLAILKAIAHECRETFVDTDEMASEWVRILADIDAVLSKIT